MDIVSSRGIESTCNYLGQQGWLKLKFCMGFLTHSQEGIKKVQMFTNKRKRGGAGGEEDDKNSQKDKKSLKTKQRKKNDRDKTNFQ